MGVVKITSMYDEEREARSGKKYSVRVVKGVKYGTDESWEQPIFHNNKDLMRKIDNFGKGELANFKYEKNGKYYDVVDIVAPDAEIIEKIDSGEMIEKRAKPSGGGNKSSYASKGNSSGMSKEEWAEKDRATNVRIAKSVAIKLACENTKVGTAPEALIEQAMAYVPWLLDASDPVTVGDIDTGADGLEPPVE